MHADDVPAQMVGPSGFVLAERASERPFVGMHSLVFLELGGKSKSLVAVATNMALGNMSCRVCLRDARAGKLSNDRGGRG